LSPSPRAPRDPHCDSPTSRRFLRAAASAFGCPARFNRICWQAKSIHAMLDDTLLQTVTEWDEWGDPSLPQHLCIPLRSTPPMV